MIILFKGTKLANTINDDKKLNRQYGPSAKIIRTCLDDLKAVSPLSVLKKLPQHRCHELKGNRKGQLAIDLIYPYRLVFEPADDPPSIKDDGGMDWENIRSIRIIEIVDYHKQGRK